jgi:hypothetical protein
MYNNNNKEFTFNKDLARKIVVIDKFTDHTPGDKYTEDEIELIDNETGRRREAWFAKLREGRGKLSTKLTGCNHGACVSECLLLWTTQEEYDYYLKCALEVSPEERYQHRKEAYYFHEFYVEGRNGFGDDSSCAYGKCVPQCRYYPQEGRIEDSEVIAEYKKYYENKILSYHVDKKGNIVYHYPVVGEG